MKALSLFSGIAGIDLAAERAGIETVAFCERDSFCQKVLKKHWPNIPIYDDVCTLTKERLDADGIGPIDIIFSGDPCQPYSLAGEREGEDDDRFLWPEVNRLLETIRPRWVVRENVAGNITMGIDGVLSDLENLGYSWESFVIPASALGALHRRDRVFIVANTDSQHVPRNIQEQIQREFEIQGSQQHRGIKEWAERSASYQPKLCRSLNGIPDGVDRVKSIGNSVAPAQIYPILAAIKQVYEMMKGESAS